MSMRCVRHLCKPIFSILICSVIIIRSSSMCTIILSRLKIRVSAYYHCTSCALELVAGCQYMVSGTGKPVFMSDKLTNTSGEVRLEVHIR